MKERFPQLLTHPKREIQQMLQDVVEGGRQRRLENIRDGDIKESVFRDSMRATVPGATILGMIGFAAPMMLEAGREMISDIFMNRPVYNDMNWSLCIGVGVGGILIGGILNAEQSRKNGKKLREDGGEFLGDFRLQIVETFLDRRWL